MAARRTRLNKHPRIDPQPIDKRISVTELVDRTFLAYNAARLREACQLFTRRMLEDDVTIGVSLTGALTPAGLGIAALIPLIEHGFIDWMTSTGANLYHDTHFGIGLNMHIGTPFADDVELREKGIVRIYDIFFDYEVLLETDAFFRTVIAAPEFQRPMSTAEFHYRVGKYVLRTRAAARPVAPLGAVHRPRARRADLHLVAGRQLDRHERRRHGAAGQPTRLRCLARRQRDGGHRSRRQGAAVARARS